MEYLKQRIFEHLGGAFETKDFWAFRRLVAASYGASHQYSLCTGLDTSSKGSTIKLLLSKLYVKLFMFSEI